MAALGVPASVAVPSLLLVNVTPEGKAPSSVIDIDAPLGVPVVVTVKDGPATPTLNVALLALVMAGAVPVVNPNTKLAAMFWPASASVTCAATTVTVQSVPCGSGALGVSVNVVEGDAESVKACGLAIGHWTVKEAVVALTDSEKLTVTVVAGFTAVAPLTGTVEVTVGSVSVVKLVT